MLFLSFPTLHYKSIAATTWPGLVSKLATYIDEQVNAGRSQNKAVDASVPGSMKTLIDLAGEAERRCGRKGLLTRRAFRLFRHVREVLEISGLASSSPTGRDYTNILREKLLQEPEYCALASTDDYDQLVRMHITWINGAENIGSEDGRRVLSTMTLLIITYPGDMSNELMRKLMRCFQRLGEKLKEGNALARVGSESFGAIKAFLLNAGRDVASSCLDLHAALHDGALMALKSKDPRLKENAVGYVRAQLLLGGISKGQLWDLKRWADNEANQTPTQW